LVWLAVTGLAGLAFWASAGARQDGTAPDDEKTGGDTTVFATGQNAFSFPLANLPDEERTRFVSLLDLKPDDCVLEVACGTVDDRGELVHRRHLRA
jgi:hypothetical protein